MEALNKYPLIDKTAPFPAIVKRFADLQGEKKRMEEENPRYVGLCATIGIVDGWIKEREEDMKTSGMTEKEIQRQIESALRA